MYTHELEQEIEIANTASSMKQLKDCYDNMARTAIDLTIRSQSLEEAVTNVLPEDMLKQIGEERNRIVNDYVWRYVTEEDKAILNSYGYTKPIVLVDEEQAHNAYTKGSPVFLLGQDDTEMVAQNFDQVAEHIENGGLVGVTQYYMDDFYEDLVMTEDDLDVDGDDIE